MGEVKKHDTELIESVFDFIHSNYIIFDRSSGHIDTIESALAKYQMHKAKEEGRD